MVPGWFSWFFMVPGQLSMVPGWLSWFFMVTGWFFMVPGRFSWFFMVPGWFFMVPGRFSWLFMGVTGPSIDKLKGWDEGRYDGGDVGCLDVLPHLHLQLLLHHLHNGHLPQDSQQV